ncbi:MAG: DUF2851 family protein [Bacteroidales bacterium]|nr:DUF2851 family protein [Bacteroidales bacterium]
MEELMYYVWQQRLFSAIHTLDNTPLEIIHPGLRNLDAGPDFFNAKIKIGDIMWAGNVEMHVKASDWYRHHHQDDQAYNSVILHVVMEADTVIERPSGDTIQMVVMRIPDAITQRYHTLVSEGKNLFCAIRCQQFLHSVPSLIVHDWLSALATQRMLRKADRVKDLILQNHESWQEALYVILSRSLGTGINSDAFERLARSLPYAFLLKHLDDPLQVRALLLGQAGLIPTDDQRLLNEYTFLRAKFQLKPMQASDWKMARRRPQASPEKRIEALAQLLSSHRELFSEILDTLQIAQLQRIFILPQLIGTQTANSIIINAIIPILISYGQWSADSDLCDRAIELLESLPAENNRYIDYWSQAGIQSNNAFDTQALLHLYREYCEPHKCINCRIGCWLIKTPDPTSPNRSKPLPF